MILNYIEVYFKAMDVIKFYFREWGTIFRTYVRKGCSLDIVRLAIFGEHVRQKASLNTVRKMSPILFF